MLHKQCASTAIVVHFLKQNKSFLQKQNNAVWEQDRSELVDMQTLNWLFGWLHQLQTSLIVFSYKYGLLDMTTNSFYGLLLIHRLHNCSLHRIATYMTSFNSPLHYTLSIDLL